MIPRVLTLILLLAACLTLPADAAPAKRKAGTARKAAATVTRAKAKAATTVTRPKPAPAPTRTTAAPRRLEDIHIEGEIPAPQVLFVTARDQRRFTRFHHQRYLKSSVQVGETTQLPTRIGLTGSSPTPADKP